MSLANAGIAGLGIGIGLVIGVGITHLIHRIIARNLDDEDKP